MLMHFTTFYFKFYNLHNVTNLHFISVSHQPALYRSLQIYKVGQFWLVITQLHIVQIHFGQNTATASCVRPRNLWQNDFVKLSAINNKSSRFKGQSSVIISQTKCDLEVAISRAVQAVSSAGLI